MCSMKMTHTMFFEKMQSNPLIKLLSVKLQLSGRRFQNYHVNRVKTKNKRKSVFKSVRFLTLFLCPFLIRDSSAAVANVPIFYSTVVMEQDLGKVRLRFLLDSGCF